MNYVPFKRAPGIGHLQFISDNLLSCKYFISYSLIDGLLFAVSPIGELRENSERSVYQSVTPSHAFPSLCQITLVNISDVI